MASEASAIRPRFFARPESLMLTVLVAAAICLVAAAVIGGRKAGTSTSALTTETSGETTGPSTEGPGYTSTLGKGPKVGPQSTAGAQTTTGGPAKGGAAAVPGGLTRTGERKSVVGATREGVHKDHFEFGVHGPITFDGAPLPLAEDPITGIKGYVTWVNRNGGVNGLKVRAYIDDDRYTTAGGRATADRLAKEVKPFFIGGTLGIDQIHKVALGAHAARIPYFAGGGPEPELKSIGMYQGYTNYDEDMRILAQWICKYGKQYVGENEIRLGTTTLNSELILPVEKRFVSDMQRRGCVRPVDAKARGTINKPTEQSTYTAQLLDLKNSYGGKGANLIVALQDPISTSRQVAENRSFRSPTYNPKWTFSNFAHDSDTALSLMGGDWTGVRGLSPGCYYHPSGGGTPYNAARCAKMGVAHVRWNSLGNVQYDQNAGGSAGGKGSYNYNEESWTADGSGGAYGYQIVFFWYGAMKSIGADPTREKFVAALKAYDRYADLITSPITFRGSPNVMIGANKFVMLEGKSNLKYRQVTEITPGLVDHF